MLLEDRHLMPKILLVILLSLSSTLGYKIGVGIADCTGPSAEIVFMGYAKTSQKGCGIHLRQFSRAFIFDDGLKRAAFVSVDAAMMGHGVRREVLRRLGKLYDQIYTEHNVILSGTHSHGTPGGFLMDLMLDIPTYGFCRATFDALVVGITNVRELYYAQKKSIITAHENMVGGKVYLTSGELLGANINRSPNSYLLNPADERANYDYDVDKEMTQLKFVKSSDGSVIGAINWFAVHPTSMNNTNCLVTSDNVGYASLLLEQMMNKNALPGQGPFVGAFASTNLGDVSPNLKGPRCVNSGDKCDNLFSTCDGHNQFCIASGPGKDMFDSTRIIAHRLFGKAKELLADDGNAAEITGEMDYIHQYVDMPKQSAIVKHPNGSSETVFGCLPAMGYSFAAGTTDGPGEMDFHQGTLSTNPFWNKIRDAIFPPTAEDVSCQHPKPILINTGRISTPYQWQSRIVSTQLVRIGDVILTAVPGEFTTMSGRRLRNTVRDAVLRAGGSPKTKAIITGLSNTYTSYIATPEEYKLQRYEGASTIFGPHTLTLYLRVYGKLAEAMIKNVKLDPGPTPPDFSSKLISLITPVLFDTSGWRRNFGECLLHPAERVKRGETVTAKFIAGHPRNNLMLGKSFLTVERSSGKEDQNWTVVATDANWETRFIWTRTSFLRGGSEATVQWDTSDLVPAGTYRIRHFGHYKYIFGGVFAYEGTTNNFQLE